MSPDSKVHGTNMGPTWVLSAPDEPHVGPMNFVIWEDRSPSNGCQATYLIFSKTRPITIVPIETHIFHFNTMHDNILQPQTTIFIQFSMCKKALICFTDNIELCMPCIMLTYSSFHCSDIIMSVIASQITNLTIVYSTIYSCTDQRKHQSSTLLTFVRGIHQWPVNSPHKGPVTQKMFPFDDGIMHPGDATIPKKTRPSARQCQLQS